MLHPTFQCVTCMCYSFSVNKIAINYEQSLLSTIQYTQVASTARLAVSQVITTS